MKNKTCEDCLYYRDTREEEGYIMYCSHPKRKCYYESIARCDGGFKSKLPTPFETRLNKLKSRLATKSEKY